MFIDQDFIYWERRGKPPVPPPPPYSIWQGFSPNVNILFHKRVENLGFQNTEIEFKLCQASLKVPQAYSCMYEREYISGPLPYPPPKTEIAALPTMAFSPQNLESYI